MFYDGGLNNAHFFEKVYCYATWQNLTQEQRIQRCSHHGVHDAKFVLSEDKCATKEKW